MSFISTEIPVPELIADLFSTVMSKRRATYVSVPVTTGRRFIEWYAQRGKSLEADNLRDKYDDELKRLVVVPNAESAGRLIRRLRRSAPTSIFIDPSSFKK